MYDLFVDLLYYRYESSSQDNIKFYTNIEKEFVSTELWCVCVDWRSASVSFEFMME